MHMGRLSNYNQLNNVRYACTHPSNALFGNIDHIVTTMTQIYYKYEKYSLRRMKNRIKFTAYHEWVCGGMDMVVLY